MYETMTYETIMRKMLARVPNSFDKREGSIIFDALAPAAAELAQMYVALDMVLEQTFADTATFEYLDKRCAERGIHRRAAVCAVVEAEFQPAAVAVLGKRFRCGIYHYQVTAATETAGTYELICETAGEAPNAVTGQLIPIEYISGLQSAGITRIVIPGADAEDDENLRERYFASIEGQAFGGNIAYYKEKAMEVPGVGGVKVTPVWNGGGTVLLTIISNDKTNPSPTEKLVADVKEVIDPSAHEGEGKGLAPIGHVVTVQGVKACIIDIKTDITYEDGWDWSSCKNAIEKAIDTYFLSLFDKWEKQEQLIVYASGIVQAILSCAGVQDLDVGNLTLNDQKGNLKLAVNEIPVRGRFNGN